jgi:hypothetical protein
MRPAGSWLNIVAAICLGWAGSQEAAGAYVGGAATVAPATRADGGPDRTSTIGALEGPLSPAEVALFRDAGDGRWDEHTLLTAALVAGGIGDASELQRYEKRFGLLVDELRGVLTDHATARGRAEAIFAFMHGRILTGGYHLESSGLAEALDEGRYNCVSASVLFNCLAGEFGLHACGLEATSHAASRLILPEGPLDVETTCPSWFRLMNDPKRQAEALAATLGREASATTAGRREVSSVQFVATIYYNRGVDCLADRRFAEAAAANAKALRLDPANETARGNLLATLNNWAIEVSAQGEQATAMRLLHQGLAIDPDYAAFVANYPHVYRRWISTLQNSVP